MTVIAVVKNKQGKLMMGGDRRSSMGWHYSQSMETPKISKKNGILVGATGSGGLCNLLVAKGGFKLPKCQPEYDVDFYMYNIFKPKLDNFLRRHGYINTTGALDAPPGHAIELVLGVKNEVWSVGIGREDSSFNEPPPHMGIILDMDRMSSPYATGCGGHGTADAIFRFMMLEKKYITKDELEKALKVVADISPGVDDNIDILVGD